MLHVRSIDSDNNFTFCAMFETIKYITARHVIVVEEANCYRN